MCSDISAVRMAGVTAQQQTPSTSNPGGVSLEMQLHRSRRTADLTGWSRGPTLRLDPTRHVIDMPEEEAAPAPPAPQNPAAVNVAALVPAADDTVTDGHFCVCPKLVLQVVKAGFSQGAATTATFGTKPLVEALVKQCLLQYSPAVAAGPAGPIIAAAIGGAYAGFIHTLIGRSVAAAMNQLMQADTHALRRGQNALAHEIGTIDVPVFLGFDATYAMRGYLMGSNVSIGADAWSKLVATAVGGFIQGMITETIKLKMPEAYDRRQPAANGDPSTAFVDEFRRNWDNLVSKRSLGHDLIGKVAGSIVGNVLATGMGQELAATDHSLAPAASGAAGMTIYLAAWFAAIHAAAACIDDSAPAPSRSGNRGIASTASAIFSRPQGPATRSTVVPARPEPPAAAPPPGPDPENPGRALEEGAAPSDDGLAL